MSNKGIDKERVTEILQEYIAESDMFLVDVVVKPGNMIRVELDRPSGISIDECVEISRNINRQMDRDLEDFSLEVSSPGLGNPFKVKQQYEKSKGREVEVLKEDGTLLVGTLQSVSDGGILLLANEKEQEVRFDDIKTTKATISFK